MNETQYIKLTLLHVCIGSLIAFYPPFSKIYAALIVVTSIYIVVKNRNENNEVLYAIAYIAGSEVFLRMHHATAFYEFGKYLMLLFTFLGFYYSGLPKIKSPFWIYLIMLVPAVILSFMFIESDVRKKIFFEILGPFCLGVLALYNYKRKITGAEINKILTLIALPIVACCVYLILNFSNHTHIVIPNGSNFYFSGGFGPNQVGTMFGLGAFIFLLKIVTEPYNRKVFFINVILFCLISYRGLLTFSRGGMVTAVVVGLILILSLNISKQGYFRLKRKLGLLTVIMASIFLLTAYQTGNSLYARYSNVELINQDRHLKTRGRYVQVETDFKNFSEHPILGVGAGGSKELRTQKQQIEVSTHSEVTRLLSEHGILGLSCLLILIFCPLQLYRKDFRNFYLLPFFIFWLFSVNHAATRIIAPIFLYTLTLLQVKFENDNPSPDRSKLPCSADSRNSC